MLLRILNYSDIYTHKPYKSKFWNKFDFNLTVQYKSSNYIMLWECIWLCKMAVINEYFAFLLLITAYIHLMLSSAFCMHTTRIDYDIKLRMLYILERLPIIGIKYKKIQSMFAHVNSDWDSHNC